MPWYIILAIIVGQFLLILYMRDHHEVTVGVLNTRIATLQDSNDNLSKSFDQCELTKKSTVKLAELTFNEVLQSRDEQHRIETELCKLGWSVTPNPDNDTFELEKPSANTIKPDDVFDASINRLLKNAYDCATNRVCLRPNP